MRNPSKVSCKKLMRRAWLVAINGGRRYNNDEKDYWFFNTVGARLYIMSKEKICNREPKGYFKHVKR